MNGRTHVCFKCRKAKRDEHFASACKCTDCGEIMTIISYKFEVPKHSKIKEWKKLEAACGVWSAGDKLIRSRHKKRN